MLQIAERAGNCKKLLEMDEMAGNGNDNDDENNNYNGEEWNWIALSQSWLCLVILPCASMQVKRKRKSETNGCLRESLLVYPLLSKIKLKKCVIGNYKDTLVYCCLHV